jgi:hypothetical protein
MCANYKYLPTNTATVKGPEQTLHNTFTCASYWYNMRNKTEKTHCQNNSFIQSKNRRNSNPSHTMKHVHNRSLSWLGTAILNVFLYGIDLSMFPVDETSDITTCDIKTSYHFLERLCTCFIVCEGLLFLRFFDWMKELFWQCVFSVLFLILYQ